MHAGKQLGCVCVCVCGLLPALHLVNLQYLDLMFLHWAVVCEAADSRCALRCQGRARRETWTDGPEEQIFPSGRPIFILPEL